MVQYLAPKTEIYVNIVSIANPLLIYSCEM